MSRRRIAAVVVGAALATLAGCASMLRPPRAGDPAPTLADPVAEDQYANTLERWTGRYEVYQGFDTRVFFAATFQSMPFREARVARAAAFRALPQAEVQAMLAAEQQAHAGSLEFVLGLHVNERRFDDFARPDSMWRIALVSEAGEAHPLSIERIGRPDATMRAFYPYLDQFWVAYRLRFPRTFENGVRVLPEQAGRFSLVLASALGRAEMVFQLDAPQPGPMSVWP